MIDCQQHTRHLASMGAKEVRRVAFEARLTPCLREPPIRDWAYDLRTWRHLGVGEFVEPARKDNGL